MLAVEKIRCRKHCPSRFYKTRLGKRRRYQCRICGKTFCRTPVRLIIDSNNRRTTFDEVATLSVEGMSKSAIARVKGIAWIRSIAAGKSSRLVSSLQQSTIKASPLRSFKQTKSKRSSEARNNRCGSSP